MSQRSTKERLLDAAERLFADQGFAATSLRDLTAAADANLAAVNYHFGSKDALLEAVFEHRLGPVNRARLELLDGFEAEHGNDAVALERILWANLSPPFRKLHDERDPGSNFMRLVARLNVDPNHHIHEVFLRQFETVRQRFLAALERTLPHLDRTEVERRMHYVLGSMMHTFCWSQAVHCLCSVAPPEGDQVLRSLIGFAAAGMRAPAGNPALDLEPQAVGVSA